MRHLRSISFCTLLIAAPSATISQDDDGSFIERTIQNALSGAGREVNVTGFSGALSSTATMEELTIADAGGVWLRMTDAQLDWRRAALLRGRLELNSLTAASITLSRLPATEAAEEESSGFQLPQLPPPEATQFALPELPVSIQIGEFSIANLSIAQPVIGQAVDASLAGSAALADGEGQVNLNIERVDSQRGVFALAGSFANSDEILSLNLTVSEGEGGIVASLLNVPDRPSLDLSIAGEGPVSDFTAKIGLRTDSIDRLTGQVAVGTNTENDRTEQFFEANLAGDITPLLQPDYREFVGEDLSLEVSGVRLPEGGLDLDTLRLDAAELDIEGQLTLGPDAWPRRIDLRGQITPFDGGSVLLAIPGPPTRMAGANLSFAFDETEGDAWLMSLTADDISRDGFALGSVLLGGQGIIKHGEGELVGEARGQLSTRLQGIDLGDDALTEAVGSALQAQFDFVLEEDAPFEFKNLTVTGADYGLTGDVTVVVPEDSPSPTIDGQFTLHAEELARFAAVAGQPISGGARVDVSGEIVPLDGSFDLEISGATNDLAAGIEQLDPLLAGAGSLSVDARRDGTGTYVDQLSIRTPLSDVAGKISISSGRTEGDIRAEIQDAAVLHPDMAGGAVVEARFIQNGDAVNADLSLRGPGGTQADITARTPDGAERTDVDGTIASEDLSVFAWAVGRPVNGRVRFDVLGDVAPQDAAFDLNVSGSTQDLAVGIEQIDPLISGTGELAVIARRDDTGIYADDMTLKTALAELSGSVSISGGTNAGQVRARILDTSVIHPDMLGDAVIDAKFDQSGDVINAELSLQAPGETVATVVARTPDGAERTSFDATIGSEDLSVYAWAAGQPIGGALDIRAEGDVELSSVALSARVNGSLTELRTGIPEADTLLKGVAEIVLDADRDEDGEITVTSLAVTAPRLNVLASGSVGGDQSQIDYSVGIPDIGLIVPDLPGALESDGTVTTDGDVFGVDSTLSGPGGLTAALVGTVQSDVSEVDLSANGTVPLAIANRQLAPNIIEGPLQFDLALKGPPELGSVAGTVTVNGARMSLPGAGVALKSIDSTVALSNGQAQVDATISPEPAGQIRVTGPITLSDPFPGNLNIAINRVGVARAGLIETEAQGDLTINGVLTGGAQITGQINFEEIAIQVPSSSGASSASLPGLQHVGEPSGSRTTRLRAGLVETEESSATAPGPPYGLDVVISAPSRIFIRGRGLDAEMGGELRIGGTTNAIAPSGRFELIRGRLNLLGQRVDLTEGYIEPQGDLDPYMEIVAEAKSGEIDVKITIAGEVSNPEFTFSSSPELPEDEVLAQFLFGRDLSEVSTVQALQIASAIRELSGQGTGAFGRVRDSLGLDDLDVSTDSSGETTVRAGRYLSENIYSDIARSTDGQTEINLNLELTPSLTARGTAKSDSTSAIGLFLERDY